MKVLITIEADIDNEKFYDFKESLEEEIFYFLGNKDFNLDMEEVE